LLIFAHRRLTIHEWLHFLPIVGKSPMENKTRNSFKQFNIFTEANRDFTLRLSPIGFLKTLEAPEG